MKRASRSFQSKRLFHITLLTIATGVALSCNSEKQESEKKSTMTNTIEKDYLESNTLPNLKLIEIESKNTGQKYVVGVGVPINYETSPNKSYPVVYQTDAEGSLHSNIEMSRGLSAQGQLEEAIIVGVFNYGEKSRWLDLTPSELTDPAIKAQNGIDSNVPTGGSEDFFKFLVNELKPKIDTEYRTDKNTNVLFGHSLGGLFCLSALQKKESPFSHYLISSPSIWWNNREVFQKPIPERDIDPIVYLSVGEFEQIPDNLPQEIVDLFPPDMLKADKDVSMVTGMIEAYDYLVKNDIEVYSYIEPFGQHTGANFPGFSKGIRTLLPSVNQDEMRRRLSNRPALPW